MALMGYNVKRKDTPPPVQSIEIYTKTLDIPTSEGRLNIRSQLLTAISLIPNTKDDVKSSTTRLRKSTETPTTSPNGDQFKTWRSLDSRLSEKERTHVIQDTPKALKPTKGMNRSRSLTPNHYSSSRPRSSMKRSATFSGKIKTKSPKDAKNLNDFHNAKMMEKTNTSCTNCCQMVVMILVVAFSIFLCLCLFDSNFSTPPYDHNEMLINISGFQKYLNRNFFRQTHTVNFLQELLKKELNGEKHERPLVLSFHGGPGVGKTFLAESTAKHLFTNGLESPCVHNFISSLHITDGGNKINRDIMEWFLQQKNIRCPLELFIVDNIDVLSPQLVNYVLKNIQQSLQDSSVVKSSILILTGTIGKEKMLIRDCTYESCYLEVTEFLKKELHSWKINDTSELIEGFEPLDQSFSFPESSHILAFFPLKREHVKLCAYRVLQRYLSTERITDELLEKVASEISFDNLGNGKAYSKSGCKQVAEKAILHI